MDQPVVAPPSHSRLSPSKAGRWVHCPGAVIMGEQFPEPKGRNEAADEGTASHWVASETLEDRGTPQPGPVAPNNVTISMEMIEGAMVYVEAVRQAAAGAQLNVEARIQAAYIHPDCWGTTDLWFLKGRELHVWDYKYGFSIVDPFECWQLICYAAGIIQHIGLNGHDDQNTDVVFHIVQPRPFHVLGSHRTWRVKACDLRGHFNRLADAANKALDPDPATLSGDHCKYCSARHACQAAQRAALFAIDYSGQAVAELLSPEALAIELRTMQRAAEAIKFRLTGLQAQAEGCIKAGGIVPGWALQQGQGRLAWTKPVEEVFAFGDLMGVNLRAAPAAVTPAEAKKLKLPVDLIAAYAAAGDSGVKLVPTDCSLASRVFRS